MPKLLSHGLYFKVWHFYLTAQCELDACSLRIYPETWMWMWPTNPCHHQLPAPGSRQRELPLGCTCMEFHSIQFLVFSLDVSYETLILCTSTHKYLDKHSAYCSTSEHFWCIFWNISEVCVKERQITIHLKLLELLMHGMLCEVHSLNFSFLGYTTFVQLQFWNI